MQFPSCGGRAPPEAMRSEVCGLCAEVCGKILEIHSDLGKVRRLGRMSCEVGVRRSATVFGHPIGWRQLHSTASGLHAVAINGPFPKSRSCHCQVRPAGENGPLILCLDTSGSMARKGQGKRMGRDRAMDCWQMRSDLTSGRSTF